MKKNKRSKWRNSARITISYDLMYAFAHLLERSEARIDATNKMVSRLVDAIERENRERHEFLRRERVRLDRLIKENTDLRIQNRRLMYSVERKGDYINMQNSILNSTKGVSIVIE